MLALFARIALRLMGWKITSVIPPDTKKCVIAVAPHTSYWDFVIGRLAYWLLGVKASFLIKKEVFKFPFRRLLLHMGGIPVDRGRSSKMVDQVVEKFKNSESLFIVITPEGTRNPVKQWKKGFYYIASQAGVPIALGYLDYAKKEGGVGKVIMPNGDLENQMKEIKEFYRGMTPRHPEKFFMEIWIFIQSSFIVQLIKSIGIYYGIQFPDILDFDYQQFMVNKYILLRG